MSYLGIDIGTSGVKALLMDRSGRALGDATAINAGLGFGWSIVLFGVAILVPLGLWRAGLPAVGCFWASYALTRPLGASVADFLAAKPSAGSRVEIPRASIKVPCMTSVGGRPSAARRPRGR